MFFTVLIGFAFLWSSGETSCVTPLGQTSECILVNNCEAFMSAFRKLPVPDHIITFMRASGCGFEKEIPLVCCGPVPDYEDVKNPQTRAIMVSPVSGTVDPVVPEDSYLMPKNQCGMDTSGGDKLYGAKNTELGEHPWMALIGYLSDDDLLSYSCVGMLINQRYVLSAAHCAIGNIEVTNGRLAKVRLGEHDIFQNEDCDKSGTRCAAAPQEIDIQSAYAHSGFSAQNRNRKDDILLIRLAKRAQFTFDVQPICMMSKNMNLEVDDEVWVAGWGKTESGSSSRYKQKAKLKLVSTTECREKYSSVHNIQLTDKQICAAGDQGQDTCQGDSGGPLMRNVAGKWEAVGIVSFGYDCGVKTWPGVYISLAPYEDWIQNTMSSSNVLIRPDSTTESNDQRHNHHDHHHHHHKY